jgi:S1-C subfamily serine protease
MPSVTSKPVEGEDFEVDEPERGWLHPDDRLWRHPSEIGAAHGSAMSSAAPAPRKSPHAWAVAGLAGAISALLTAGIIAAAGGFPTREVPVRSVERVSVSTPVNLAIGPTDGVVEAAQRLRPSIVEITADASDGHKVGGSGVAFRDDGYILTNCHVVDGASNIKVVTATGQTLTAELVGVDDETDIGVIKVPGAMRAATLGSANSLQVGQRAIAIGSPVGLGGGPSVTVGVVSALGRPFDNKDGHFLVDMIQTDAPIAPGSSGGALVNAAGDVVGITTSIAVNTAGAEGIGFATPIDIARDVAQQIVTTGHVTHIWLGVRGEDLDDAMANALGVAGGALVREVTKGSPAEVAGIRARDIIMNVDGKAVHSIADVVISVRHRKVGDRVRLTVWRDAKPKIVNVKLTERVG